MAWNIESLTEHLLIGSTLVEGSTLSENEARLALQGKTITGHPLSEMRELINYRQAVQWFMHQLNESPYLSIDLVLNFHQQLMSGLSDQAGQWKTRINYTYQSDGKRHDYLHPTEVSQAIKQWVGRFNLDHHEKPQVGIAELYLEFQNIHPFEDGNGRIGRILASYWLHWKWSKSFCFYFKDKLPHLKALEAGNHGDLHVLINFFTKRMKKGEL